MQFEYSFTLNVVTNQPTHYIAYIKHESPVVEQRWHVSICSKIVFLQYASTRSRLYVAGLVNNVSKFIKF